MAGEYAVAVAQDQRAGLTMGELYQFVQAADAAGVDPRTPVTIQVGFRSQLKAVSVTNSVERARI